MLPTVIKACPSAEEDFKPLSEYQEQTPDSFFEGKPVLYFHDQKVKAWCSNEQYDQLSFFKSGDSSESSLHPTPPESHALTNNGGEHMREERVEVFVASSTLTIYSHKSKTGIEIPYPSISLHAVKNFKHTEKPDDASSKFMGVYIQLEFSGDGADDDDGPDPVELTLIPTSASSEDSAAEPDSSIDPLNSERTSALYNQISACQNLHPDPEDEDEDDEEDPMDRIVFEGEAIEGLPGAYQGDWNGGLPPPMPGSSGWITAENVNEFFDEDGNWIGEEGVSGELGEGAGHARTRDEVDGDDLNGHEANEQSPPKRPRTE